MELIRRIECYLRKRHKDMSFIHFRSDQFSAEDRREAVEETYGNVCGMDIDILASESVTEVQVSVLPDTAVAKGKLENHWAARSYQHIADGDDSFLLILPRSGKLGLSHRGRDQVFCAPGQLHLAPVEDPFQTRDSGGLTVTTMSIPASWVEKRLLNLDAFVKKTQTPNDPSALNLMVNYIDCVLAERRSLPAYSAMCVSEHLFDLAMLAIGADAETTHTAAGRGARHAHLLTIKKFIKDNCQVPDISAEKVARVCHISPQYLRKILRDSGTTFSDYLNAVRLDMVYDQLARSVRDSRPVYVLAYDAGFHNLAWFNRAFRNRFGMTPSEVRELAFANAAQ